MRFALLRVAERRYTCHLWVLFYQPPTPVEPARRQHLR